MKADVVAQITIDASPTEVFKYLSDLKYHFLWNPHLQSISPQTPLKLGMTYRSSSLLLGVKVRGHNKVTKLVPNEEIELENKAGLVRYNVAYRLLTKQAKTQVVCTTTVYLNSEIFKFAHSVPQMLARRELQTDLQALKIAVEQQLE